MESNYRQTSIEKGIDDIIVKILFPITNQLLSKTQQNMAVQFIVLIVMFPILSILNL